VLSGVTIHRPRTVRQQVRDELRAAILGGQIAPGSNLPSTQELAVRWGSPVANVHAALTTLAKEGLLVRVPGVGTVVNRPEARLERVALYSRTNALAHEETAFERAVLSELSADLGRRGVGVEVLVDPRPMEAQGTELEALARMASERKVQAVIAACVAPEHVVWLRKLPVVTAFVSSLPLRNAVRIDPQPFVEASLRILQRQGCRRVALITSWASQAPGRVQPFGVLANPLDRFAAQAQELGLETRAEWLVTPASEIPAEDYEAFGHQAFRKLWAAADRPEALIVFTDFVARGVLHGVLESGARIPGQLRLVLHRNAELPYYCPVPATFVELSVREAARELIKLVEGQFRGEPAHPVTLSFSAFEHEVSPPSPLETVILANATPEGLELVRSRLTAAG
jgi:DNA-binding LacI/PurR family transcriptional regulator